MYVIKIKRGFTTTCILTINQTRQQMSKLPRGGHWTFDVTMHGRLKSSVQLFTFFMATPMQLAQCYVTKINDWVLVVASSFGSVFQAIYFFSFWFLSARDCIRIVKISFELTTNYLFFSVQFSNYLGVYSHTSIGFLFGLLN